jgi:hypothetical protein
VLIDERKCPPRHCIDARTGEAQRKAGLPAVLRNLEAGLTDGPAVLVKYSDLGATPVYRLGKEQREALRRFQDKAVGRRIGAFQNRVRIRLYGSDNQR